MIYIFWAAFDPPHAGHSAIIRAVLHYKNPSAIIIMPSGKRDDKTYHVSDEHRLAMLRIFCDELNSSLESSLKTEQDFSSSIGIDPELQKPQDDKKPRVIIDDYFIENWEGEMITRDVDEYAKRAYGDDVVHIFGTDTIEGMPEWDSEQYAAKVVKKLFVPRNFKKDKLERVMEWEWCRFSPWEGGVRGGYTEYNPSLLEYAKENRKQPNDMEKNMWFLLRWEKLGYKFHRQKLIWEYIVDFYSSSLQLVIEIDGESHIANIEYDNKRTAYLNHLWIQVLRFTNSELMWSLEWVREHLLQWIERIRNSLSCNPSQPPLFRGGVGDHPGLSFSEEKLAQIQNYSLFTNSHIPDISSTEIRRIIPEYTNLKQLFEEDPRFIIPGLSRKISQYILENRLYRPKPEQKPKILVHVCCGPDVTMPILQLRDEYDVICFWYDPNIQPKAEYDKRYEAFVKICEIEDIPYIKGAYDVGNFFTRIKWVEHTPERGEKCTYCYDMRMMVSAKLAHRLKIPYYTSSLNTSPKKDLEKLFHMWHKYGEKYNVEFLDIPFRKRWGFEKSVEYTKEHDIYRQNYCGCIYSIREGGDSDMKKRMVG